MRRTYAWRDGQLVELTTEAVSELHYIQPDIAEFRSSDGALIGGRSQWREHLNRTGSIEMGHADMRNAQENWGKKKEAFQQKLKRNTGEVKPVNISDEIRPVVLSRVNAEMRNRLEGRPMPNRKMLIKLTMETARDLARRR